MRLNPWKRILKVTITTILVFAVMIVFNPSGLQTAQAQTVKRTSILAQGDAITDP